MNPIIIPAYGPPRRLPLPSGRALVVGGGTARVNVHELRIFQAVVEQRGFARGAQSANLTQSAVSQAIRRLEEEVGAPLLTRARPPALTAAGRRLLVHAQDVLARDAMVRRDIEELKKGGEGVLALGASQALSRDLLPALTREFVARHPRAALHLETLPSRELIGVVADGKLELGLGPFQRAMPFLELHPLGTQRMVLYAGRASASLGRLRKEGGAALREIPLVTSHLDAPGTRPGKGLLRERFRAVWEVHSLDLRIALVKQGLAVGYLPESIVARAPELARTMVALDWIEFGAIDRKMGLFHSSRRPLSLLGASFLSLTSELGARGSRGRRA